MSRLIINRINAARKRVREGLLNWEYWMSQQVPQVVPRAYTIEDVFQGKPPWDTSVPGAQAVSGEELQLRLCKAKAELQRCREELFSCQERLPTA